MYHVPGKDRTQGGARWKKYKTGLGVGVREEIQERIYGGEDWNKDILMPALECPIKNVELLERKSPTLLKT